MNGCDEKCKANGILSNNEEWTDALAYISMWFTKKGFDAPKPGTLNAPVTIAGKVVTWEVFLDALMLSFTGGHHYGAHAALGIRHGNRLDELVRAAKDVLGKLFSHAPTSVAVPMPDKSEMH